MTTNTDYKPCPRSWGDGYTAGYRQAIRDAAEILDTVDNHSNQMTALDCVQAIRALAPREEDDWMLEQFDAAIDPARRIEGEL